MTSKALVAASLKPLVLSILSEGESYGYEIIQRVADLTGGKLKWTTGSLYPLLHTLENKDLLESFWKDAGPGPKRRYYRLTAKGKRSLASERKEWTCVNDALSTIWGRSQFLQHT